MRVLSRRLLAVLICAGCVAAPGEAGASIVTLAGGAMSLQIGGLVPPIVFPQSNPVLLSVSSGGGSFTEPAAVFTGAAMLPTGLFTGVPLINGLTVGVPANPVANGTKFIAQGAAGGGHATGVLRAGGGLGGPGPLAGTAVVNLLFLINLSVPLSAIGDTGGATSVYANQQFQVTVLGTGWTTAPVTLTGLTTAGLNTVTFVGYDNRDAAHNGVLKLISPFKVITSVTGNLPGLATQTLTFVGGVPEPGMLGLLGIGAAGLVSLGWRTRRR